MHNNIPVDPNQGPVWSTVMVLVALIMLVFVIAAFLDLKDENARLRNRRNGHD